MLDTARLFFLAGNGGDGKVSFRREKYVPKGGPDGGNGGDGGSIYLEVAENLNTLQALAGKKQLVAQSGGKGGKRKKTGEKGDDLILQVPPGAVVWLLAETAVPAEFRAGGEGQRAKYYLEREGQTANKPEVENWVDANGTNIAAIEEIKDWSAFPRKKLFDLRKNAERVRLCLGGSGGRGNDAFKAPGKRIPLEAEYGSFGEKKLILLELKLLADLALLGLPSVGKSSLLNRVTKAQSKVAAYPFTTLTPHLGVWQLLTGSQRESVVVADVPGLIAGASAGKGLGREFLRHIEHCQSLLYLLALDESQVFSGVNEAEQLAALQDQYRQLQQELADYDPELLERPSLIAVNKIDLYSNSLREKIHHLEFANKLGEQKPILLSVATGEGIGELQKAVAHLQLITR